MNVRIKMFGIIGLVFLVTTAITWVATVRLIQAEYVKIEVANVKKDTARSVDALGSRVDNLALKIPDWSSWDDTYQFIVDHNAEYLESNVQNSALQNLSINFMLFFNAKQQLVSYKAANVDTGDTIPVPAELTQALAPGSPLLTTKIDDGRQGIIKTATDPLILVTRPILTTDGKGPVRGTLVFAQYLSTASIAKIGQLTHLNVAYDSAKDATGMLASEAAGTSVGSARTETQGSQTITGYQLINDIYGKPVLIARVQEPRSIYQETQRTLTFYILVVIGVTLTAIIVAMYTTGKIMQQDRTIKLKNEFFSIASHELRTPLWAILGSSSMIKDEYGPKNDEKLVELADDIHEGSARLIKIVSNFLDAARLERGQMPLKVDPVMLDGPIKTVVDEMQSFAKIKNLYVKSEIAPGLKPVAADPDRVQQVIYNLTGNAMKFTEQGGITIQASNERDQVVVVVSDTGRGISPAGQQKLFESFQQAQSGDETVGSGLGLYISKLLVDRMGGHIWLKSSELGKGTAIAFSLPAATLHPLPPAPDPQPAPPPPAADAPKSTPPAN